VAANEPIDPRGRLAISQWPDDAPRGAVSTLCAEHGISRQSFYEIGKRVRTDGPAAVLEPRSRRRRSSPPKLTQVDAFDHIYNTQRPHQGLPGRLTPLAAWQAEPPRPARSRTDPSTSRPYPS